MLSHYQVLLLYTFWFLIYTCSYMYMHCLRLFIVVLQDRTTLFTTMFTVIIVVYLLKTMCIPSFVLIGCCVSEIRAHLCPYRNVWPEGVYCIVYRKFIP